MRALQTSSGLRTNGACMVIVCRREGEEHSVLVGLVFLRGDPSLQGASVQEAQG